MVIIDITKARGTLSSLFDRAHDKHERIVIQRHGRDKVAIVPIEDVETLQRMENDLLDTAHAAFNERGKSIPWDDVKKKLEL